MQHLNVAARVVGGGGVSSINKKVEVKEELVASPQAVESERICSSVQSPSHTFVGNLLFRICLSIFFLEV